MTSEVFWSVETSWADEALATTLQSKREATKAPSPREKSSVASFRLLLARSVRLGRGTERRRAGRRGREPRSRSRLRLFLGGCCCCCCCCCSNCCCSRLLCSLPRLTRAHTPGWVQLHKPARPVPPAACLPASQCGNVAIGKRSCELRALMGTCSAPPATPLCGGKEGAAAWRRRQQQQRAALPAFPGRAEVPPKKQLLVPDL